MHRLVASWFGSGLIMGKLRHSDAGSGTVGSLFAGVVAFLLYQQIHWVLQMASAVLVLVLGLWSTTALVDTEGDAGWIVVDEAGGVFLALIGLTTWPAALVAFVVFRAADILKSVFPGVSSAESRPGSLGVMGDDVVAGLYGLAAGHLFQTLV